MFLRNGSLTVVDSDFEDCAAVGIDNANGLPSDGWGGAIAASRGSLTIRGSSFSFNLRPAARRWPRRPGRQRPGRGDLRHRPADRARHPRQLDQRQHRHRRHRVTRGGNGRGGGLAAFSAPPRRLPARACRPTRPSAGSPSSGTSGTGLGGGIAVEATTLSVTDGEFADNVANGPDSTAGLAGTPTAAGFTRSASTLTSSRPPSPATGRPRATGLPMRSNGLARGGGLQLSDTSLDRRRRRPSHSNTSTGDNPTGGGHRSSMHENSPPRRS